MAARRAADGLPCLNSNISINSVDKAPKLNGYHKRARFVLESEIERLADQFGIDRILFGTLTIGDTVNGRFVGVMKHKECNRRFRSLRTNVLAGRYERGVWVRQRHVSGALHIHVVVVATQPMRSGVDFEAIARGDYRSASPALREEWAFWRETAPRYGFGRTEWLPVKSTKESIAKYLGKYIGKDFAERLSIDKGARFFGFWGYGPDRKFHPNFAGADDHARLWRLKLRNFCLSKGFSAETTMSVQAGMAVKTGSYQKYWQVGDDIEEEVVKTKNATVLTERLDGAFEILKRFWGRRWAHRLREEIILTPVSDSDLATFSLPIVMQERERRESAELEKLRLLHAVTSSISIVDKENSI